MAVLSAAVERASVIPPPVRLSAPPPPRHSSAPPFFSAPLPSMPPGPSTEHASIPATRHPSLRPPQNSQAARIAAIASVPPTPHARSAAPRPVSIPPAAAAPIDLMSELLMQRPPPPIPVTPAEQEQDSIIEHARIMPASPPNPEEPSVLSPTPSPAVMHVRHESDHPGDGPTRVSAPPPAMRRSAPPGPVMGSSPPSSQGSGQVAARLADLARDALLSEDNAALEQWVDGLRASGESPAFTERLGAMARLGRGDIGDALRVLRRTRQELDPQDHRRRCQTSLALGVALSVAGRPDEALLESLDALARARQIKDDRGAKACMMFLAKLYTITGRHADAARLREAAG